jgi:hypothetical protein
MAPGEGGVGPAHPPCSDRRTEAPMYQISLGDQHQAGGVSVESVDNPGSPFRTAGERGAPRDERVDEGVVPVSWRRVHHQSRRLVDDREMLVLEDDGERNGAGLDGARRLMLGKANGDLFTTGEGPGSPRRLTIDADQFVRDKTRRLRAGESELIGEEPIEPLGLWRQN